MKTLFFAICVAFAFFPANGQTTQHLKQDSARVWGNCEMCKGRIEKAARAAGALSAFWNVDSRILSVAYPSSTTSLANIEKAVAAAGYDTGNTTADTKAYKNLPE